MPDWGLTETQRELKPWGLPYSVLRPGKVFTDPVHGDVHLTVLEVAIIDSPVYQRLRRVRQLGMTHLVYPSAVHSRFSHCLGAVTVTQGLLDTVWNHRHGRHPVDDLFAHWGEEVGEGRWAEATILARLGALLHDLCHVPAGHTVEDDLRLLVPHDENKGRFEYLWGELATAVRADLVADFDEATAEAVTGALLAPEGELHRQVLPLIISKGDGVLRHEQMKYPFAADLVGNTICADLLDYLERDHLFTGLPLSIGTRFMSEFFVVPEDRGPFSQRLAVSIMREDHERPDVVSELLKALRYRYELTERALVHHAKLAADAMLGEALERWSWAVWYEEAASRGYWDKTAVPNFDPRLLWRYRRDWERSQHDEARGKGESVDETPAAHLAASTRDRLEDVLRRLGDDGLLDYLAFLPESGDYGTDVGPLLRDASDLAQRLIDRRLFRILGRIGAGDAPANKLYQTHGDPYARASLEAGAHHFAGIEDPAALVLWLPPPTMRLKLAEVLVQHGGGVTPFVDYERARSQRGSDIYDAHERLWAAYVFVKPEIDDEQAEVAAAYLARAMGVRWERHGYLGAAPAEWPMRLAVAKALDASPRPGLDDRLEWLGDSVEEVAAREPETFEALLAQVKEAAEVHRREERRARRQARKR